MIRDVIVEANEVNEAVEKGAIELGLTSDEVEFEIIEMPRRGFLGLKKYPAKVRVWVEEEDVVVPQRKKAVKPVEKKEAPKQEKVSAPKQEKKEAPKQNTEKKAEAPKPKREPKEHKEEKPHNFAEEKREEKKEVEPTDEVKEKAEKASAFLNDVMKKMGYENVESSPVYYEDSVNLSLSGEDSGAVIGYRGETLDALQYLSSLVANRGEGDYLRININSGNYREKREKTLINLAKRLARQAVKTGKSIKLEPMNPYERRVIHGAVAEVKGATSTSEGLDPNRFVIISSITGEPSADYVEKRRSRGGYNKNGRNGGKRPYNKDRKPRYPKGDRPARTETQENVTGEVATKRIDDSELIKNVTLGVPLVNGDKPAPKKPEVKEQPKKQIDGDLYGKIM